MCCFYIAILYNCICVVKQQHKERTSELQVIVIGLCLTGGWGVHIKRFFSMGELIIGAKTAPQKSFYMNSVFCGLQLGGRDFVIFAAT